MRILAWSVAIVLAALGLLHVGWAFGSRRPGSAVIPERAGVPLMNPGPVATLAVAALLLSAATIVLLRVDALGFGHPTPIVRLGTWVIAAVFLARALGDFHYLGFFKTVRDTRFALMDTRLYSPLCLALGLAVAVLAGKGYSGR